HSLPIIFAAPAVWRAWKSQNNHLDRWLCLWLLSAFLLTISNPSRHPADLLWMLLPLWTLAARRIALDLSWQKEDGYPAWGQAALTVLLLTFLVMTAVRLSSAPYATTALSSFQLFGQLFVINQQTVSLVSILTLGILSTALIGAGWSPADAIRGLVWGSAAFLAVFTLSTAWKPAQSPHNASRELWFPSPGSGNVSSLSTFIGDFSEYSTGLRTGIEIVSTYESDLLHWELRHYPQVRFAASFPDDQSPAALLTDQTTDNPRLAAAYRGKAISILQTPLWAQMSASQWQRWMLFREISFQNESVILWVRSDVFPEDFSLLEDLEAQSEWITP
ncbi:MAG: hypothetical protein OEV06_12720, partial [Anaerolineae bacterium]|nr:hypothetical protein [Anaerolineae bacterium]